MCSTFLSIREMQIKTTPSFRFSAVRMTKIETATSTNANEDTGKKDSHSWLVGSQVPAAIKEISVENSQKLKVNLPYNLATPLLSICQKDSSSILG